MLLFAMLSGMALIVSRRIERQPGRKEAEVFLVSLGAYSAFQWFRQYFLQPDWPPAYVTLLKGAAALSLASAAISFLLLAFSACPIRKRNLAKTCYLLIGLACGLPLLLIRSITLPGWILAGQILLPLTFAAVFGFLGWTWIKADNRREWLRGWKISLSAFFLPVVLWIMVSDFYYSLPDAGLELLLACEMFILLLCILSGRFFILNLKEEHGDVTPSIRIAHSGVQVLNHSFKNKLLTMEMSVRTIKSKLPETSAIEGELKLIELSVRHLKQMVERLREQTKEIMLREQAHSLQTIIDDTVSELSPSLPPGINIEIHDRLSAILVCDATHLREALLNILQNSIEAMGANGGLIKIYLNPVIPGNWLTFSIEDSGPGIPTGSLHRVYEPYFTTKAGKNNFGLGLSYCYNVMKASSGSIKISSPPGKGTIVVLGFNPKKVIVQPYKE